MNEDEKFARGLAEKAEHGLKLVEIGPEHDAPLDTLCFHFQQAAEKPIKTVLNCRGITYAYTHDLDELVDLCVAELPELGTFRLPSPVLVLAPTPWPCATTSHTTPAVMRFWLPGKQSRNFGPSSIPSSPPKSFPETPPSGIRTRFAPASG